MKKIILAILLAAAGAAHAEFLDGNMLLQRMNSAKEQDQSLALGYVAGAADALHGVGYCPSANVTLQQAYDLVKLFLVEMPQHRAHSADVIIFGVLKTAFPCKPKTPTSRQNPYI